MRQTTQFQQTPEILKQWKQKKEKPVCIIAVNMNEGRDFSPLFDDHTQTYTYGTLLKEQARPAHTVLQRLQNCRQREWKLKRPTEREKESRFRTRAPSV